ncbi:MAG: PAS domain-containing protein, partial [Pyrinomonadaceae bacterium]
MMNPAQANVSGNCVMPVEVGSEETGGSARQPGWSGALAATAIFAICSAAPLLIFPRLSLSALVSVPILLFGVASVFVARRAGQAQQAFDERLRVLQQQCAATAQRASEAEKHALLYDEFVASGREWESMFDALPEGAFLFDAKGRLSRINRAGVLLENSQAASLDEGIRCCDMFWRVEGAAECAVERAQALGETLEVEMATSGNAQHSVLVHVVPVRDGRGALTGNTVVIARDVSELRRAEAEAFEHKSFLASLADLAPDEIYMLDAEGRFVWMNERAEAANDSMASGLLLGRHFSEIVAADFKERAEAQLRRTLAGEDAQC